MDEYKRNLNNADGRSWGVMSELDSSGSRGGE